MSDPHKITARLWEWEGKGAWHFITIEKSQADIIKQDWPWPRKGFGSIPVSVTLGKSVWKTSIFPEKGGTYLLPIKKSVRIAEEVSKGNTITIHLTIMS